MNDVTSQLLHLNFFVCISAIPPLQNLRFPFSPLATVKGLCTHFLVRSNYQSFLLTNLQCLSGDLLD